MELLVETRKKLLRLKNELLGIKVELKFARFLRVAFKAEFKEERLHPAFSQGFRQLTTHLRRLATRWFALWKESIFFRR